MSKTRERIRTLIVDDEPLARRNLRALLKTDPEIEIIGEARSGPEAVRMIKSHSPALIFLDIQMPEMSGFEVLERISTDDLPAIVFVTAFDKYALKAFEVNASGDPAVRASCVEFVLAGLYSIDRISRSQQHGRIEYST